LSSSRKQKSSKIKAVHNSKSEGDTKILFPSSENKLVERHQEKQQRRQDEEHETDDKSQKKNVTGLTIAPTSEDTFEVIDELGNHLENIYDGCSPTFATNGEKSMNWNQPAASCLQQNNSRSKSVDATKTLLKGEFDTSDILEHELKDEEILQQKLDHSESNTSSDISNDQNEKSTDKRKSALFDHPTNIPYISKKGESSTCKDQTITLKRKEDANNDGRKEKMFLSPKFDRNIARTPSPRDPCEVFVNDEQSMKSPIDSAQSQEEHAAAIKIQSFLRLTILKSAILEWPSTINRVQAAFDTPDSSANCRIQTHSYLRCSLNEQQMIRNNIFAKKKSPASMLERNTVSRRAAALAIHNIVRTYVTALKVVREKKKAILIQASFRGYRTRKRLELEDFSALVIQFAWTDRRYIRIKAKSATKIQTLLRMYLCQREYEMRRFCIIFIQAGWRRSIARRRLVSLKSLTLALQATWRGSKDRTTYTKTLSAIRSIQHMFKVRHTITSYKKECRVATKLQSWWRMQNSRIILIRSLEAATCIQAHARSFFQCRKFRKVQFDCIIIQRNWRASYRKRRYTSFKGAALRLQTFIRTRLPIIKSHRRIRSVVLLQKFFRGFVCRHRMTKRIESSTKLQNNWRRYYEQTSYQNSIKAVIMLQAFARVVIQRKKYLSQCQAILDMQRVTRGYQGREKVYLYKDEAAKNHLIKMSNGATIIQNAWRSSVAKKRYANVIRSAILLQKVSRRIMAQSLYKKKLISGRTIQLWLGSIIEETRAQKANLASIEIQRIWRAALASRYVTSLKTKRTTSSSTRIQSIYRGARARKAFNKTRDDIITIQSFCRRRSAIKVLKTLIRQRVMAESSTLIQSQWRRFLILKHTNIVRNQKTSERASTLIQSHWRRVIACEAYEKARVSTITIQSYTRRKLASNITQGLKDRRLSKYSTLIQKNWRGALARDSFTTVRGSAILIQACTRRFLASRTTNLVAYEVVAEKCSTLIQSHWRRAQARSQFEGTKSSAILIQSAFRRMSGVKEFQFMKLRTLSSVLIQAYWRGSIARERYGQIRISTTMIQSSVRGMLTRKRFIQIVNSLLLIQRAHRAHIKRKKIHMIQTAAIYIQYKYRNFRKNRQELTEASSASLIQALWRRSYTRSVHKSNQSSAVLIQRIMRGYIIRNRFHLSHTLATKIQRKWKAVKKKRIQKATEMSILIQSYWRSSKDREKYMQYRIAILTIQAIIRGSLCRSQFQACKISAVRLQKSFRKHICRKYINEATESRKLTKSSILIQSHWRASLARETYTSCRAAAMIIQSIFRGSYVRARWSFVPLLLKKKCILNMSARKIQVAYIAWRMDIAVWELRSLNVLLQRGVRGHLARSVVEYALTHINSSRNTSIVNSHAHLVTNQDYEQGLSTITTWNTAVSGARASAAVVIQSIARRFIVRNAISRKANHASNDNFDVLTRTKTKDGKSIATQRTFYLQSQSHNICATRIQKIIRRRIALKLKSKAATKIQNFYRCRRQKLIFLFQIQSIVKIQTSWRRKLAQLSLIKMNAKRNFDVKNEAVILIQTFTRCKQQKMSYTIKKRNVILAQNLWRAIVARRSFMRLKTAASIIQAKYRCYRLQQENRNILTFHAIRIQCFIRRLNAKRSVIERRNESQRQVELASQLSSESRLASIQLVDNLLTKHKSMNNDSCLKKLASRVRFTLEEAESLSNEDIQYLVHKGPLTIPLPPVHENLEPQTSLNVKSIDSGTPVRSNKIFVMSKTTKGNSRALSIEAKFSNQESRQNHSSVQESIKNLMDATKEPSSSATKNKDIRKDRINLKTDLLSKQAMGLIREGRAAKLKNRQMNVDTKSAHRGSKVKASNRGYKKPVGEKTGLENFCDGTMPSPIRPQEGNCDWDWTSEW